MSYLSAKRDRRRKITIGTAIAAIAVVIFLLRAPIISGLSSFAHFVTLPILSMREAFGSGAENFNVHFKTKLALKEENRSLRAALDEANIRNLERDILFAENVELKTAFNRVSNPGAYVLAAILAKPPTSLYDTLVIDIGEETGIAKGAVVYAHGNVPIGTIAEVYGKTSLAKLYSTSGETVKLAVTGAGIQIDATGTGGGNFEVTLPREIEIAEGAPLTLPGIGSQPVAIVRKIISDSRDPFQTVIAATPINIQELSFVEIAR